MSTAGKRRAAGPAVTTGHTTGGARKAAPVEETSPETMPDTAAHARTAVGEVSVAVAPVVPVPVPVPVVPVPVVPVPVAAPSPLPIPAPLPSEAVDAQSSPASPRTVRATTWVRPDQWLALQDAVEARGETFDAAQWSFDRSNLLVTLARRLAPTGAHDLLVVSNECYTAWLGQWQDPVEAAGDLFKAAPLARNQIAWILDEAVRHGAGQWLLRPLGMRGWVATRRTRTRRTRHFVVAADGSFTPVASPDAEVVLAALAVLESQRQAAPSVPR